MNETGDRIVSLARQCGMLLISPPEEMLETVPGLLVSSML